MKLDLAIAITKDTERTGRTERGKSGGNSPRFLLGDFACGKSWTNRVNLDLHFIARLGLRNKDYETLDPSYSVSSTANLLDFKLVLLTLFCSHVMNDETQMKRQQFFSLSEAPRFSVIIENGSILR
jgi:hypothetical protein